MKFIKKPYRWSIIVSLSLVILTGYVLLDTFVIPRTYAIVDSGSESLESSGSNNFVSDNPSSEQNNPAYVDVTDRSYSDGNISIKISEYREYDTTIYVADIVVSDVSYLKTALAQGIYGKNITQTTSDTANSVSAILAINGDYYGSRTEGYVIRNGALYRGTSADSQQEDLVIYTDGSFEIIYENSITAEMLLQNGAETVFSFGPGLVENGNITVSQNDEVYKSKTSNPRTAIGIIDEKHYVFVVSDGRTDDSAGLSLYELGAFMQKTGCLTAYNLDGGGSSTMYFMGSVINNPTTNGKSISERKVSDIVFIGY